MGSKKYYYDENYFETINSEEKAYWLGFIAADGNVGANTGLRIGLAIKDREQLEKFKRALDADNLIREYLATNKGKKYPYCMICLRGKKILKDLNEYQIVPKKSLILEWPTKLDKTYYRHYIRGYVDGDGCFCVARAKKKRHKTSCYFSIISSCGFCTTVQDILVEKLNLNKNKIIRVGNAYRLQYGGDNVVKKIFDYLYEDATIWMSRKKEIIEKRINSDYKFNKKDISEETREKCRTAKSHTMIAVSQFDLNENFIKKYKSIAEAFRETKILNIGDAAKGKRKHAGNFIWKHEGVGL